MVKTSSLRIVGREKLILRLFLSRIPPSLKDWQWQLKKGRWWNMMHRRFTKVTKLYQYLVGEQHTGKSGLKDCLIWHLCLRYCQSWTETVWCLEPIQSLQWALVWFEKKAGVGGVMRRWGRRRISLQRIDQATGLESKQSTLCRGAGWGGEVVRC